MASSDFPSSIPYTHLPVTHVLPKDQLWILAARLVHSDIMIFFYPHMGDSTRSARLSVARGLFSSNAELCLCPITVKAIRRCFYIRWTLCVVLFAAAATVIFSYVSHIVGFNAALIGSLVLVLICMISTCYPLFIFPSHTTCFFSLLGFFLHVKLLFSPSYPSVFALSGALMSSCWPSPAVWTRWDGIYSVP